MALDREVRVWHWTGRLGCRPEKCRALWPPGMLAMAIIVIYGY